MLPTSTDLAAMAEALSRSAEYRVAATPGPRPGHSVGLVPEPPSAVLV